MLVGYAYRGSFRDPFETQISELRAAGCERMEVEEDESVGPRPARHACLARVEVGVTLAVVRLALLATNMPDLLKVMQVLSAKDAHLLSLAEELDTRLPMQEWFHMAAGFSRFLDDVRLERMLVGRQQARTRGERLGRKPKLSFDQIEHGRKLLQMGEGGRAVARTLGVSEATLYRHLKA